MSAPSKKRQRQPQAPTTRTAVFLVAGLGGLFLVCACALVVFGAVMSGRKGAEPTAVTVADPRTAVLTLAFSPEKVNLLSPLVADFNRQRRKTADGRTMEVQLLEMPPDQMVEEALGESPGFQALSPDASLWLDLLDLRWAEQQGRQAGELAPRRVAQSVRFAVSPIVIAAWPEVARTLGYGSRPVGWADIQQKAATDRDFRWSHASTAYASGMLATLAQFYAGAGKTRGLTEEDVLAPSTLEYVRRIESTVRFYGENEAVAMERMRSEGRDFLDALVVQEALVVQHNRNGGDPLVAIYPREGTLWEDHPLALLDDPAVTDNQRRTFLALAEFLLAPEQQRRVLAMGFRPADLSIPIADPDSPISARFGVDPREPQTTLQMPGPTVVRVVQNAWRYTKRPANIYLVVDTSGSMEGEKLENVRTALQTFVNQIQGTQDRVGMVLFATSVYQIIPPAPLDEAHRQRLLDEIARLEANGNTALLDGVRAAYVRLQREADAASINAIVAMTDGLENASAITLSELLRVIETDNRQGVPVLIFTIAYGTDADQRLLRRLAEVSGGQMREGTPETIRELYRLLSQYF
jgi:Ca-activated chloride channel family protein